MQNLKRCGKVSRRFVVSLGGELGHLAQSNCRNEQEKKPRAATDVSGGASPEQPGDTCNRENDERRDPPAMIRRTRAPRPSQHEQWRHYREEKKDVIQVQSRVKKLNSYIVT